MTIDWQISGHLSARGIFHELIIECAADTHGRKALMINQLGKGQRSIRQTMRAETWHNVNHRSLLWLQPKGKFQPLACSGNLDGSGLPPIGKFEVFEGEKDRLKGLE